jgi:CheY-like chemotaxis protein
LGDQNINVLVVDDEQIDIKIVRSALESAGGYTVFEADGVGAWQD